MEIIHCVGYPRLDPFEHFKLVYCFLPTDLAGEKSPVGGDIAFDELSKVHAESSRQKSFFRLFILDQKCSDTASDANCDHRGVAQDTVGPSATLAHLLVPNNDLLAIAIPNFSFEPFSVGDDGIALLHISHPTTRHH